MALYRYKAVTQPGEMLVGEMEAPSVEAVISHLRGQGWLPVRADEVKEGARGGLFSLERAGRSMPKKEIILLIRELATLLKAGLPLDQALDVLTAFSGKGRMPEILKRISDRVRGGAPLADAMAAQRGIFDRFCLGMVRVGETSGALESVLTKAADYMERAEQSRQSFRSALIYPAILVATALVSVAVIVTVVIPSFKQIFDQAGYELPLATQVLLSLSEVAERFWWLPPLVVLLAVLVVMRQRRTAAGRRRWDRRILKIPVVGGLVARSETARMAFTLATMLNNGVTLTGAIPVVRETLGNAAMAEVFDRVEARVKEGKTFSEPLAESQLFPPLAIHLVRVGEESGRLDDLLFRVAEIFERETQRGLQRIVSLLGPAVTLLMALLIAGIIVAILVPMFSIHDLTL